MLGPFGLYILSRISSDALYTNSPFLTGTLFGTSSSPSTFPSILTVATTSSFSTKLSPYSFISSLKELKLLFPAERSQLTFFTLLTTPRTHSPLLFLVTTNSPKEIFSSGLTENS
ncbi:114aa long hypothetical protein [Pyrococcus horikoshii OT3]|uniref:Uncharacterized protein n=1 Tax=Pyrococcus horikoshii (strain ATCC 700860 / DSM 12428 / JCM 9974 / NBRC 100139 / OT-3) TaxID=70601 RepID=O58684_PYRHO|nr:114aa long hypothetical protein [Pyrococcus horikoshii OT3]